LISFIEFRQNLLCTNADVNLLHLLLFMVSEMEYIRFISKAIVSSEWNEVCQRPYYRPIFWNRQKVEKKVLLLISYMKIVCWNVQEVKKSQLEVGFIIRTVRLDILILLETMVNEQNANLIITKLGFSHKESLWCDLVSIESY